MDEVTTLERKDILKVLKTVEKWAPESYLPITDRDKFWEQLQDLLNQRLLKIDGMEVE